MLKGDDIINYNWMPCVADWSLDHSEDFYKSAGVSKQCSPPELNEETASSVAAGDIVFVKTDYLKSSYFQRMILPKIQNSFTLISGISSYTVDDYQTILNNPLVVKWFCTNPPVKDKKVIGLPIGFEERERDGGNQTILRKFLNSKSDDMINKIILPYHTASTNPIRQRTIEYLKTLDFVDVQDEKLSFHEYLKLLSKYKYCICLEGAGYDTHRNYECLLVGSVPIMKTSNIKLIYDDWNLPSIFLDNWENINETFFDNILHDNYDFSNCNKFFMINTHTERISE